MRIWRSLYIKSANMVDALLVVFWIGILIGLIFGFTFAMFWAFKLGWVGLGT